MAKKTLTLHLAKPDTVEFDRVLSEQARDRLHRASTRIIEADAFADGGRLYVFVGDDSIPAWLRDLRRVFNVPGNIATSSSCAVLAFRTSGRLFVSTFAHGWMYLNEDNIEGDFGLRVALNALDERKLKRLERANLGDALRGVSLSPYQREFTSFGLDDALDLVRRISGVTREDATADSLSGSRSLKVSGEFAIGDLPAIASEALEFYGSIDYQNSSFKIIDFVSPITDHRLAALLDELAVQSIIEENDDFELGLPISYEDDSVAYGFAGPSLRGRYPDLLLKHYTASLGGRLPALTVQTLKDHKVIASYEDDARPDRKCSIRSALVGSLTHEAGRYAINDGEWYRVDQLFKESIEDGFQRLVEQWEVAPTPLRKIYDAKGRNGRYQIEADYNAEMAAANGFVLLDTRLIEIPGVQRSGFEPCDLLDIEGKRFIHVKKSSRRSNILSHFFKQGSNSAQQFSRFPAAWDELFILVGNVAGQAAMDQLRLSVEDSERPWRVHFVIADAPRRGGDFNIPFFSKISLRDEAINLKAMGYEVAVRFIGLEPDEIE